MQKLKKYIAKQNKTDRYKDVILYLNEDELMSINATKMSRKEQAEAMLTLLEMGIFTIDQLIVMDVINVFYETSIV